MINYAQMPALVVELILITLTFLLALYELVGIIRAKRLGLTTNTARIITHSLIIVFILGSIIQRLYWKKQIFQLGSEVISLHNIPLLSLTAAVAVLSGIEAFKVYRAKKEGLTDNISRIITHSAMFILMTAVISINLLVF